MPSSGGGSIGEVFARLPVQAATGYQGAVDEFAALHEGLVFEREKRHGFQRVEGGAAVLAGDIDVAYGMYLLELLERAEVER